MQSVRQQKPRSMHTCISLYCCMVDDWLERLACNAESTGSSLVRFSYCVGSLGTLSKFFFVHYCCAVYCICAAEACKYVLFLYKDVAWKIGVILGGYPLHLTRLEKIVFVFMTVIDLILEV